MNVLIITYCVIEVIFSMGITVCCCFSKYNEAALLGIFMVVLFFACVMIGIFDGE